MQLGLAIVAAALLAPLASASPQHNARGRDVCKEAVSRGPVPAPPHITPTVAAKSDCASFLRKTVSPCSVTQTTTRTAVQTAKPVTKITSQTVTITPTTTGVIFNTFNLTLVSTQVQTESQTLELSSTTTQLTTKTVTSISTIFETVSVTSTYSTEVVISTQVTTSTLDLWDKRNTPPTGLPALTRPVVAELDARENNAGCKASTSSAKNIPTYASPCRGPKEYSSACRGIGVAEQTTTLSAPTIWRSVTVTNVFTPTITETSTATVQKTTTILVTKPITNLYTTIATTALTRTVTSTTVITVTSTITSVISATAVVTTTEIDSVVATSTQAQTSVVTYTPEPQCTTGFVLRAPGPAPGRYIRSASSSSSSLIGFTNDFPGATVFNVDSKGHIFVVLSGLRMNVNNLSLFSIYLDSENDISSGGYLPLTCSTASGNLRCSASNGNNGFYYCPASGSKDLLFGSEAGAARYGCSASDKLVPLVVC